jgi:hypothetical protein
VVALSGHGNKDEIGRENRTQVGSDLNQKQTASLLNAVGFRQGQIRLSICGSTAVYNTFAEKLMTELTNLFNPESGKLKIYYPDKNLNSDRDPLSLADMYSVDN